MSDLLTTIEGRVATLTFNKTSKHNAFDEAFLQQFDIALEAVVKNPDIRVIVLTGNGNHFCAGADINWMQRMIDYNEADNRRDAQLLANAIYRLYRCPKLTIGVAHGATFGGGLGFLAACDIAIAANTARFCFSEIKLGLIPAVISPYIVRAIGQRAALWLFTSAEVFDAEKALALQLIHHCINEQELNEFSRQYAQTLSRSAPQAILDCKRLVHLVAHAPIDDTLVDYTASVIAQKRVSPEGQEGLRAFLEKRQPNWS